MPRTTRIAGALLVLVTAVSWWIGSGHGLDRRAAGAVVLTLAAAKAAVVASEFMELRGAPRGLRAAVLLEVLGGGLALVVLFLCDGP